MSQILLYVLFFFVGIITSWFYFSHLWKSISENKTDKGKIIFSSFIRFPVPIIAAILAGYFSGIMGIIVFIFGFSVFQFIYLIKKGSQLKKDLEDYVKQQENQQDNQQ